MKFLSNSIEKYNPDTLIVLGDRYEMLLGPIVAMLYNLPIIHFYGGASTQGAIDELIRHAITKMSHYHFVVLESYKKRLLQMGEEKWRVFNVGHTAADRYKSIKNISYSNLSKYLKLNFKNEPLIVFIQHPVSNWLSKTKKHFRISLSAIDSLNFPTVIIGSNSDPGNVVMRSEYKKLWCL